VVLYFVMKEDRMNFLITAGGTREYIDPVRFISNASSGRMGYALAEVAMDAGHEAVLISASDLQPPVGVEFVGVESAAQMFAAVKKYFDKCDCLIMAAAVSDYTPVKKSKVKIKKSKMDLAIRLKPTADILKWAGRQKIKDKKSKIKNQILAGFALEDRNLKTYAENKLRQKNLDMIIVNTPDAIGGEVSSVQIKTRAGSWQKIAKKTKRYIAKRIISCLEQMPVKCR
jgi:phosphopantothenoylcysteine decarboxylase / phosphopantothenate---cysteine ligase